MVIMETAVITVYLADDNIIVREGVRAMLARAKDIEVVGVADDYDSLVAGAEAAAPQVVVTDIRMPPAFQREGIDAAQLIRKRHPGTGVVILSQYDDPDYAVALLSEGASGYAYLLKDRIAEGDQLASAIRTVAQGGSMLDPVIVNALVRPVTRPGELAPADEELLGLVAAGRPLKAIALARRTTAAAVAEDVERLFRVLADGASSGQQGALRRLRMLHEAIVEREERSESLSRLLPGGVAERLLRGGKAIGESEECIVTVLMSDIRGYTTIAEHAEPAQIVAQLNVHRAEMNRAILDQAGTVMQYVGDAVMAVFGAPEPCPDHAERALAAAIAMHAAQATVNERWCAEGLPPFGLGIGLSTGSVAAAIMGSEERLEYTVIGDAVNLCNRLQQLASPGQTVCSGPHWRELATVPPDHEELPPQLVKGRDTPVVAYRFPVATFATPVPSSTSPGGDTA